MIFVIEPRRAGKTYTLIDWFLENPDGHIIIVSTVQEKRRVIDEIRKRIPETSITYWENRVFTYRQADGYVLHGRQVKIGIDDVEAYIRSHFAPNHVELVTGTGTVMRPREQ
jgi:hypothetical protein